MAVDSAQPDLLAEVMAELRALQASLLAVSVLPKGVAGAVAVQRVLEEERALPVLRELHGKLGQSSEVPVRAFRLLCCGKG